MKKKLAAVTVTILLVSVITNSFLNGGKPDWIDYALHRWRVY
ncbi:hypothetical protein [Bacillus sp. N1(2025)]